MSQTPIVIDNSNKHKKAHSNLVPLKRVKTNKKNINLIAKIERLNKSELVEYCKNIGLETTGKSKSILMEEAQKYGNHEIKEAIETGKGLELLTEKMEVLAEEYATNLNSKIENRKQEMKP